MKIFYEKTTNKERQAVQSIVYDPNIDTSNFDNVVSFDVLPEAQAPTGTTAKLYYNETTNSLLWEYVTTDPTPEENALSKRMSDVENALLSMQGLI